MKPWRTVFFLSLIAWPFLLAAKPDSKPSEAAKEQRRVVVLDIAGAIGPATSDFVHRSLSQAKDMNAALVVLRIDTPGGLDTAMRKIVQDIIASPVPVATFVAPSGARAASAGTYILYASHIAAMAPGTNVGSATPVRIGGAPDPGAPAPREKDEQKGKENGEDGKTKSDKKTKESKKQPAAKDDDAMTKKTLNDAIAYLKSLAQMRGRNVEWAEKAVRDAANLPAEEAVKLNVADLIADDVPNLLQKLHGRKVKVAQGELVLHTKGIPTQTIEPDWRSRLLSVITDPNIAYILMMLGIYGLFFELWNPGYVLPGVIGGICLLLALYAFQVLPVNYAGLGLILLGIVFMVSEVFMPSFGALGIGGVIAFVVGSIILLDTEVEGFEIAWELIASVTVLSAVLFIGVAMMALRIRKRQVVSGQEEMLGSVGETLEAFRGRGRVRVHSEDWSAETNSPLKRGQRIRVVGIEGLVLKVEPVED